VRKLQLFMRSLRGTGINGRAAWAGVESISWVLLDASQRWRLGILASPRLEGFVGYVIRKGRAEISISS
jgi:hypothetical protein